MGVCGHRLTQTGLYSVCNMVVVFVTNIVTVVISAARCAKQLGIGDVTWQILFLLVKVCLTILSCWINASSKSIAILKINATEIFNTN